MKGYSLGLGAPQAAKLDGPEGEETNGRRRQEVSEAGGRVLRRAGAKGYPGRDTGEQSHSGPCTSFSDLCTVHATRSECLIRSSVLLVPPERSPEDAGAATEAAELQEALQLAARKEGELAATPADTREPDSNEVCFYLSSRGRTPKCCTHQVNAARLVLDLTQTAASQDLLQLLGFYLVLSRMTRSAGYIGSVSSSSMGQKAGHT